MVRTTVRNLTWISAVLFATLVVVRQQVAAEEEGDDGYVERSFTLRSKDASALMTPFVWDLSQMMRISATFETRSHFGALLQITGRSEATGKVPFKLYAQIEHHAVWLTMLDEFQQVVATLRSRSVDATNGEKHRISISVVLGSFLVLQTDTDDQSAKIGMLNYTTLTVETIFGAAKGSIEHSVVGCISSISVVLRTRTFYLPISELSAGTSDGCLDLCASAPCHHVSKNKCQNYFSHYRCDCFETDYEGDTCADEARTVDFNGHQYIAYDTERLIEERRAHRIALRFKATNRGRGEIMSALLGSFSQPGETIILLVSMLEDGTSGVGFSGCMKQIYVGHRNVLLLSKSPYLTSRFPLTYGCQTSTNEIDEKARQPTTCKETFCQHRTTCIEDSGTQCDCGDTKYMGRYCQFSSLYRSCQELLDMGETISGVYLIDPDGSGSANASYVFCEMDLKNGLGTTVVEHNVPDAVTIRGQNEFFDAVYEIHFQTCNCDGNVSQQTFDEGYLYGVYSGLTEVTVLQNSSDVEANLTLGPLLCTGSHGHDDVIQFKRRGAVLEETAWLGRSMSFWFRTNIPETTIISQQSSDDRYLEIGISEGNREADLCSLIRCYSCVRTLTT
ncbi:unnamed protein product [Soboliphyme baturini]|uniref:EGF-like domain-containing protein n=1 Tax=Soboliphyme baturini TaxID=241478 RepID=A0A183IE53_9BILA|nr:unnamed protein product [Soboliphyme baturini]